MVVPERVALGRVKAADKLIEVLDTRERSRAINSHTVLCADTKRIENVIFDG